MANRDSRDAWNRLRDHLRAADDATVLSVPRRRGFPHPRDAGARLTATWPVGQVADYLIEGHPPLTVREYPDRWEAFIESARLSGQVLGAVERDPKAALYLGAAMVGGAIGTSVSNKREGLLLGAGLGLLAAAIVDGTMRPRK